MESILRFGLTGKVLHAFFLKEQFYKNNEAEICSDFKNKIRTIEARLQMEI